jgi:hypothetical protein
MIDTHTHTHKPTNKQTCSSSSFANTPSLFQFTLMIFQTKKKKRQIVLLKRIVICNPKTQTPKTDILKEILLTE